MKFLILILCIIALIFAAGLPAEYHIAAPIRSLYRMAAEWEPAIGSIIAWPLIIPKSLVIELAKGKMLPRMAMNIFDLLGIRGAGVHF